MAGRNSDGSEYACEFPTSTSLHEFHECLLDLTSTMLFTTCDRALRRAAVPHEEFVELVRNLRKGGYIHNFREEAVHEESLELRALKYSLRSGESSYERLTINENFFPWFRRAQDQLNQELLGNLPISFHDLAFDCSMSCYRAVSMYFSHYDRDYDKILKKHLAIGSKLKDNFQIFRSILQSEATRALNILATDTLANKTTLDDEVQLDFEKSIKAVEGNGSTERPPYSNAASYDRDKWIYENIECNSYAGLQLKLKKVAKKYKFDVISSRLGLKKAADKYAEYHNLKKRRFSKSASAKS